MTQDAPCDRCGRTPAEEAFHEDGILVRACHACVAELTEYGWLNSWLAVRVRRAREGEPQA